MGVKYFSRIMYNQESIILLHCAAITCAHMDWYFCGKNLNVFPGFFFLSFVHIPAAKTVLFSCQKCYFDSNIPETCIVFERTSTLPLDGIQKQL